MAAVITYRVSPDWTEEDWLYYQHDETGAPCVTEFHSAAGTFRSRWPYFPDCQYAGWLDQHDGHFYFQAKGKTYWAPAIQEPNPFD